MYYQENKWAEAIAERLSDEWIGKDEFPEDADLLKEVLEKALSVMPDECMRLVGTGIIEKSYFDPLD
jgi:predicted transcriptional regulator